MANSQSAQAQLEQAQLRLSYTKIVAPVDGIVMKRSAEVGARVSPGQQLMTIAEAGEILGDRPTSRRRSFPACSPSRPPEFTWMPCTATFDGYVDTIGGGTGAISSVLPPENATGNYVKVVQRIPVRLRFRPNQQGLELLRAGMSVEPEVHNRQIGCRPTRHRRQSGGPRIIRI